MPTSLLVEFVNLVTVISNIEIEVEAELSGIKQYSFQHKFNTLIGGLAKILVLIVISCNRWYFCTHEQIFGGIPIKI
ncbi:hypothetical protein EVA_04917 [gut metagenome]|uniref:Uncharacterized protein n=1 Tax=gut metagenome TaxID=749906 RepID=J9GIJ4_9ZZZZ